jgi:hypothetical protein
MYVVAALACSLILLKTCVSPKDTERDHISIVIDSEETSTDESLLNVQSDNEM